jgi:hypothetical protein
MVCWNTVKPNQTPEQRTREIARDMDRIDSLVANGQVRFVVGPQGAPLFDGLTREQRDNLDDVCIYRQLSRTGSRATQAAIAAAERTVGRTTDRNAMVHSHDGGRTWDRNHVHGGR